MPSPAGGFSDHVGLEFLDIKDGYSHCRVEVTDRHLNPHDVLHGGVINTMADTGMGAALQMGLGEDEVCATIELKTNYLQSVRDGVVECETEVIHRGKSTAYLESEITQDDDLVAKATGSFSIFTP